MPLDSILLYFSQTVHNSNSPLNMSVQVVDGRLLVIFPYLFLPGTMCRCVRACLLLGPSILEFVSVCVRFFIMKLITSRFLNAVLLSLWCFVHFAGLFSYTALTDTLVYYNIINNMSYTHTFLYTCSSELGILIVCLSVYKCTYT